MDKGIEMESKGFAGFAAGLLLLACGTAQALGTFIPAPARTDMAYDDRRGLVYVASGDEILRYRVQDGTFLAPVALGGMLQGIDISPDGDTLAVADRSHDSGQVWVFTIDLDTLEAVRVEAPADDYEAGTWTVSYAHDGSLFVTSRFAGSGWTPMRRFPSQGGEAEVLATVRQDTMLAASGDRRKIAFAESDISDGRWGVVDAVSGDIVRREWYEDGTSAFNYEIASNVDGSQYAIPTYFGTYVYDADYARVATFGEYAGPQPVGLAYHPVDALAYFPWAETREVRVYDMEFLEEVGRYDFEHVFGHTGNHAFGAGRTKLSGDGSLLMVSVAGGVRILRLYEPLRAEPVSVRVGARMSRLKTLIPLRAAVGNGGDVSYEIVSQPAHGRVVLGGGIAAYTPAPGYSGNDSFVYRARYGRAWADAVVTVSVD